MKSFLLFESNSGASVDSPFKVESPSVGQFSISVIEKNFSRPAGILLVILLKTNLFLLPDSLMYFIWIVLLISNFHAVDILNSHVNFLSWIESPRQ